MEEFEGDDELVTEDLATIIKGAVETVLGVEAVPYEPAKVNSWCSQIMDQCLKELIKASKPFKYVITCVIMQKTNAGIQTVTTSFWDNKTDGLSSVQLDGANFHVIVTVFAMHI